MNIVTRTTITLTQVIPFDAKHYPGLTLEQALDEEREQANPEYGLEELITRFIEGLQFAVFEHGHIPTPRQPFADLSHTVTVQED